MKNKNIYLYGCFVVFFFFSSRVFAENSTLTPITIQVKGNASVSVVPNQTIIRIGIHQTAKKLTEAQKKCQQAMLKIKKVLKNESLDFKDVQTNRYTINQSFNYDKGKRIFLGYTVEHILSISITHKVDAGKLIDKLVLNGANTLDSVNFDIIDKKDLYEQALKKAIDNAYEKAHVLEKKLHLKIKGIQSFKEDQSGSSIPRGLYKGEGASSTSFFKGHYEVQAGVEMVFLVVANS